MPMLTDEEIDSMRETTFASLPDTCRIVSSVLATTAGGGTRPTVTIGPALACSVVPAMSSAINEAAVMERLGNLEAWMVSIPAETAIAEKERLDVLVGGVTRRLEVQAVYGPESFELERRVVCTEVS